MLRYSHVVPPFSSGNYRGWNGRVPPCGSDAWVPVVGNAFADWEAYQSGELPVIHEVRRSLLSNFAPVRIRMRGEVYGSVEHAYQAAKTEVATERECIQQATNPTQARQFGRAVTLRDGWDGLRFAVMGGLLRQKFAQAA